MDSCKTIIIAAAGVLAAWSSPAATNFYAQAAVTETNVYLGQVFSLDILVKAAEKPAAPNLAQVTDFNAALLDPGRPTSDANTWLYRFSLRAKREGKLQVPSLRFGTLYTKALTVQAQKPAFTERMSLDMKLSPTSVYQGEPLLLTTTWDSTYQLGAIKAVDFHFPILNDERFQVLDLYEPDKEVKAHTTGLPVHGTRVLATRKNYKTDDAQHQSLSFSKLLIPKASGSITISPATLLCAADKEKSTKNKQSLRSAFQYPAYFDNTFFDQNVTGDRWSRIYAESKPVQLEVKPLPIDGRPALFNGMVGEFDIAATAEPLEVQVGEPITLTITITASNYMENIIFEPLRYQPLLINRFEIPSDRSLPKRNGKSKVYTQTIRALSTATSEIPPIQLAYFSPKTERYVTVQSDPIPLRVSPAAEVSVFGGSLRRNRLRAAEEGIRHNHDHPDLLRNRRQPLFGTHLLIVLAILLTPPLVVNLISLASLFGEKKHHIHRTAKAARAYKVFRKNAAHIVLSHSMKREIYCDLDEVLRAYFGDRFHINPGALSIREVEARLIKAGVDNETLTLLNDLFTVCEAYRFTEGFDEAANAKPIVHEATRIIKKVEKCLK